MAKKTWRATRVNVPYCILAIPPRATWNNKMGSTNTTMMATINNSHKHKRKRELGVVLTWSEKWRLGKKLWGWHSSCPCFSSICNTKQHKGKHNAQPWPPWWTNKTKKVEHKNMKGKRSSTWCSHGTKKKGEEELWIMMLLVSLLLLPMQHETHDGEHWHNHDSHNEIFKWQKGMGARHGIHLNKQIGRQKGIWGVLAMVANEIQTKKTNTPNPSHFTQDLHALKT